MILGISLVFFSVSFLLYRHPPSSWKFATSRTPDNSQHTLSHGISSGQAAKDQDSRAAAQVDRQAERPQENAVPSYEAPRDASLSLETTPKSNPVAGNGHVPSFSLDITVEDEDDDDDADDNLPPPSFPAADSIQRAGARSNVSTRATFEATGPRTFASPSPSALMPPPPPPPKPRMSGNSLAPSIAAGSYRAPTAGPLPNRNPPLASNSLATPITAPLSIPNPRKKVELTPGHSPLDWARLQKSGASLSGVTSLQRVKPSQLRYHNGRKGRPAWSAWQGKVYNITPYLPFHPGGEGELRRAAGKPGEKLFMEVHPWVNWENMLGECMVGILVAENDGAESAKRANMDSLD